MTSMANLEACLPAHLHGDTTTITRIAVGLSGAGVYRVEVAGQTFVMKVARETEPLESWRRRLEIQHLAANAGVAPRVIHVDEERRAIVSAFVADRSFPAYYGNPLTRDAALTLLGLTLRRIHEIPLPTDVDALDPRDFLRTIWSQSLATFAVPAFVRDAVRRVLDEDGPPRERALVLSHNDVNPTNLVYDGEHLMILDWDTAGPNDPFYDLGAIAVFLRMDDETSLKLLSAYDGAPVSTIPERFTYDRRVAAVLCGAAFLHLARQSGHAGATGGETLESTRSIGDLYQLMRTGAMTLAAGESQWAFGLALVQAGVVVSSPRADERR